MVVPSTTDCVPKHYVIMVASTADCVPKYYVILVPSTADCVPKHYEYVILVPSTADCVPKYYVILVPTALFPCSFYSSSASRCVPDVSPRLKPPPNCMDSDVREFEVDRG